MHQRVEMFFKKKLGDYDWLSLLQCAYANQNKEFGVKHSKEH